MLIEGYKRDPHPKIETHRAATVRPLIAPDDPTVLAVASDSAHPELDRPVLDLNATAEIADFILRRPVCSRWNGPLDETAALEERLFRAAARR